MTADILLLGQTGQLGWEIDRRARAAGITMAGGGRDRLDITDPAAIATAMHAAGPKVVINAAAYTAVDRAEDDAATAHAVNRDGPANLAAACAAAGIPLIHVSTDYVFNGTKDGPYVETDPVGPNCVYGASKLAGEEAVRAATPHHIILRTAWLFGPHGHNFVKTMLRLARQHPVLRVVDDQRGCPTLAGDLADAILILARKAIQGRLDRAEDFGTFHCCGGGSTTWCGFARAIFDIAAPHLPAVPTVQGISTAEYPTPARRPANSVLCCDKLASVHGIRLRPWRDALADMLGEIPGTGAGDANNLAPGRPRR